MNKPTVAVSSKSLAQPSKMRWYNSMRFIVTAVTVGLISASILSIGILNERSTRRSLTEQSQNRLLLEARNLAYLSTEALLSDYPELTLQPLVNQITAELPKGSLAVITDPGGNVRGHIDSRQLGKTFEAPPSMTPARGNSQLRPGERIEADSETLIAIAPATYGDDVIALAYVAMPRAHLETMIRDARTGQLFVLGLLLFASTLLALLLMSKLLRPIRVIVKGLDKIGDGDFAAAIELRDRTEMGTLARHINSMATKLRIAQEEMVQRMRLSHEMELARNIQKSLLPDSERHFGDFSVHGDHISAQEVGGDYYDIFEMPDNRIGLVIADVAGKGLAGCLATSMLAAYLRAYRETIMSPAELLNQLDDQLSRTLPRGTFVTMFYGILDIKQSTLVFGSAGHIPPLIYRSDTGTTEWLKARGIPLAMVRDVSKRPVRVEMETQFKSGDVLVQMTDGINEAWNEGRSEQLGLDRVEGIVKRSASGGPRRVLMSIKDAVESWTGWQSKADDETLLIVGRRAPNQPQDANSQAFDALNQMNPEECLRTARSDGNKLRLYPNLDSLRAIRAWLDQCPIISESAKEELGIINAALVDACANIIEHGGHTPDKGDIELIWNQGRDENLKPYNPEDAIFDERIWRASLVVRGFFVICDRGNPFDPRSWSPRNLQKLKTAGRGIGLNLINTAMWRIQYQSETADGNITVLHYHPVKHWMKEEVHNV